MDNEFNDRAKEKQESRERDERMLANGEITVEELSKRNGFFSALDHFKARIVRRRKSRP